MDYRKKKILTYFTIGLIFLLSGIEYAVILPTIWRYLQTLGAAPYFLGLGLSAFSLTGLLSGPLFGHWSDKTRTTKKIILFANMFEIVGNFMYFMGYSKWLLLSSRLVAGIGTGAGSSIFGFLTRSTATEDRATVFAAVMACRQAGLLIGPAFNIFLRLCDFHIGPFVVNKYTAPGLFMCLLWILLQLAVVFMYWDLQPQEVAGPAPRASAPDVTRVDGEVSESGGERGTGGERGLAVKEEGEENRADVVDEEEEEEFDDEVKPLMGSCRELLSGSYGSVVVVTPDPHSVTASQQQHPLPPPPTTAVHNGTLPHISSSPTSPTPAPQRPESPGEAEGSPSPSKKFSLGREFLREEVVVLLAAQFITLFNQTALETMVTPMTQKYFDFGELENSVMYCICGVEVIACFLFVRWLSTRVAERMVLAVGLVLCNVSCVWCLIFLAKPIGGFQWQLTEFIIGVFLQVIGLPFVAVAQVSLFSKVTAEKTQGFSQGVRRSVGGLATILGPLWAGGLTDNMYIMLGVMMGLLVLLTIMVMVSYERLVEPPVVQHADNNNDDCG